MWPLGEGEAETSRLPPGGIHVSTWDMYALGQKHVWGGRTTAEKAQT